MPTQKNFSKNPRINLLIENILDELCPFLEEQANEISELTAIGKALGAGRDITVLLEMILSIARRFTKADGGTLYLVNHDTQSLEFNVFHNESLGIKQCKASLEFTGVELFNPDQSPNVSNVSSYAFHTGKTVNIKDVYKTRRFSFDGTRIFDDTLEYKSKSMIVIPMKNHQDEIIGILQLINARQAGTGKIISFSVDAQEKAVALASQASVILTQQMLILEMRQLFEAFIKAIAVSIDDKSKHTGGHIQRVTELSLLIAEKINRDTTCFKNRSLSSDEMDELRIAALMHDTGKITTPDHIIGKSSRLQTIIDRIELIQTRWDLFKTNIKLVAAQKKLALLENSNHTPQFDEIDKACEKQINILENEFETICSINTNKDYLSLEQLDILKDIHAKYCVIGGKKHSYLSADEFENLCIAKGTLTTAERETINHHADLTEKILSKLPWPKNLAKIPFIAGAHHEKLDGTGYPLGLDSRDLNIQARILAVADVFEALSAPDRPYKNPMNLSKIKTILKGMGENGSLDKDIIQVFFSSNAHLEYAKDRLSPSQIDIQPN